MKMLVSWVDEGEGEEGHERGWRAHERWPCTTLPPMRSTTERTGNLPHMDCMSDSKCSHNMRL